MTDPPASAIIDGCLPGQSMFSIVFSNRYEILERSLLDRLAEERPGPFGRREVVVPSSALRRRLELVIADREGICANVGFDYLAQWLWAQIGKVVKVEARSPFAPALLAWRIFGLIDPASADSEWVQAHPRLARYLAGADGRMCFELAERIARVFDHYLTYRPQWLERWAAGQTAGLEAADDTARADEAWQAAIWRRIHDSLTLGRTHPAVQFLQRVVGMDEAELASLGLPRTVHVFALPALPPLYLDILRELARVVDVRLYALNPCREFWFEIVDARRLSWLAARQEELFHETGNRLLAAWGQQTQAHIGLLFEGEYAVVEEADFEPHPGRHVLARLHNAILDLEELRPGGVPLAAGDRSIEVHVCHSRTRELEVLHDRLLALLKGSQPPRPDEIVVLLPDLESAAPLIEAVFGTVPAARRIPWRITGLGSTQENPVARALDSLLSLLVGRFPATRVFDLLQQEVVAAHFGLSEGDLESVHDWMRAAGIRWGLDAGQAGDMAAVPVHTLEEGLHRLFLAWAAGDAAAVAPFAGRIGAAAPEGSTGLALGRFWRYAQMLQRVQGRVRRPQCGSDWRATLLDALDDLVGGAESWTESLREVREAIGALTDDMSAGLGAAVIGLDVLHPALVARLDDPARGGVPGGTVTFSALTSLRSLPYRVVCVLGLDQGAFPGSDRPAEFDLMATRPRRGDRQRRLDDRNLFLDVILSAREVLHLSYVGRSARDGAELPPSVLVDELLDTLAQACAEDPGSPEALLAARRRLTVHHPLQAFSLDYFVPVKGADSRLVSFNDDYAKALAARMRHRLRGEGGRVPQGAAAGWVQDGDEEGDEGHAEAVQRPFFELPLAAPEPLWREVGLMQLVRFFRNPCRFLLRERLGLDLPEVEEALDDVEPFLPDWPGRQALAARLLPTLLSATGQTLEPEGLMELARAGGEYPGGVIGDTALRDEVACLCDFAGRVIRAGADAVLPPHAPRLVFDIDGETWSLSAAFGDLRPRGWTFQRYDDTRPVDYLAAWLHHLVLNAAPLAGCEGDTLGLSRDGEFRLEGLGVEEAHAALAVLIRLYRAGLSAPLHFFPKSAWAYVVNGEKVGAALQRWRGGRNPAFAESQDPAYRLALRGRGEALNEDFFSHALTVFGPLLRHLDDARLG